jgi:hypothetical protein
MLAQVASGFQQKSYYENDGREGCVSKATLHGHNRLKSRLVVKFD